VNTLLHQPKRHFNFLQRFRPISLRFILVVPFVLQLCFAVGLTSWFSLHHSQKAVNEFAIQLRDRASAEVVHHLEDVLTVPKTINQINLDLSHNQYLPLDDFNSLGQYFWQQMQLFDVGYINYANAQGEFVGVERLSSGQFVINEQSQATNHRFNVYATNGEGDRIRLLSSEPDEDPRLEAWYADAVQARQPIWSEIYSWQDKPDVWSISSSYPLYDSTSRLQGVLGVDLILSDLNYFLQKTIASPGATTFVMEHDGLLVASSTPEFSPSSKVSAQRILATQSPNPLIQAIAQRLIQQFGSWQKLPENQALALYVGRQKEHIEITTWHDAMGLDWVVVVVVPESDFMAQIYSSARKTILLSLLFLALATLLGLMTARWISGRIRQLVRASQAIANGDLNQAVRVQSIREFELLSRSFNQMAITLKTSFDDLERRVCQRTAELAAAKDAALQEAARSADANRAKSEFLATMSHELRTPLNVILGFVQVMQHDTSLPPTYQDYLDSIRRSGEHLLSLINDVLKASKLEVGKVSLQTSSFDLYHLLDTLYRMMQLKANSKGLQLIVDCTPEVPQYIHTDASKLRQVLINLLDNAVKFCDAGRVILKVSCAEGERLDSALTFAVEDTGPGIAIADLNQLFEPFMQTKTGRQSQQGTGLGLYISHRFVRLMGGELICESEVNRGTCFRFTITAYPSSSPSRPSTPPELSWMSNATFMYENSKDSSMLSLYLTQMPTEWTTQLHQAAIKGFDHVIIQLAEQIPDTYAPLAQQLKRWAIDFEFDPVIALIQEIPK